MADFLTNLGHLIDMLLGYLGVQGHGLEASVYALGATVALGACVALRSAIRIAFLRCPGRR